MARRTFSRASIIVSALAIAPGCIIVDGSLDSLDESGATGDSADASAGSDSSTQSSAATQSTDSGDGDSESSGDGDGDGDPCQDVAAPDEVLGPGADPEGGEFTLEEALADLPEGPGPLRAELQTNLGTFVCELRPDESPIAVANFVGLARGRRAWLDPVSSQWVRRPYYDGTIFHRVIPDFMIQGGDILGTGFGGPGYAFEDEFSSLVHTPGTLSSANSGPDTNGSQFFITQVATNWLDGVHTVMGYCDPVSGVEAVASVPTDANDKPLEDVVLEEVRIVRCEPVAKP